MSKNQSTQSTQSIKKVGKVGRKPTTRNAILLALRENPGQTAAQLAASTGINVSTAYMISLTKGDRPLVTRAGSVKTSTHAEGRGRPSMQFKLGSGGGLVASNLARHAQKAAKAISEAVSADTNDMVAA